MAYSITPEELHFIQSRIVQRGVKQNDESFELLVGLLYLLFCFAVLQYFFQIKLGLDELL
jgi:hypothetical protein